MVNSKYKGLCTMPKCLINPWLKIPEGERKHRKCWDSHLEVTPKSLYLDKIKLTAYTLPLPSSTGNFFVHRTFFDISIKPQMINIEVRQCLKKKKAQESIKELRVRFILGNYCNNSHWFVDWEKELSSIWTSWYFQIRTS